MDAMIGKYKKKVAEFAKIMRTTSVDGAMMRKSMILK